MMYHWLEEDYHWLEEGSYEDFKRNILASDLPCESDLVPGMPMWRALQAVADPVDETCVAREFWQNDVATKTAGTQAAPALVRGRLPAGDHGAAD
jgi:hypothetical protein